MAKINPNALTLRNRASGKVGWAVAWLLGVPLPLLLVIYAISKC